MYACTGCMSKFVETVLASGAIVGKNEMELNTFFLSFFLTFFLRQ